DRIVRCPKCNYAANLERADTGRRCPLTDPRVGEGADNDSTHDSAATVEWDELEQIDTPNATSIEQVCKMLKCKPEEMIKTLIYLADGKPVAVLIRGDREANEGKIRRTLEADALELADEKTIFDVTGAPVGFAGPVGIDCRILADHDIPLLVNPISGANAADAHNTGVNIGRDYQVEATYDLRNAVAEDPCPNCAGTLEMVHGIEAGHVFKLGTKYSESLNAYFVDEKEKRHPVIMGCYGIGINRIVAAACETSHDENGLIWPLAIAPYEVLVVPLKIDDEEVMQIATRFYEELQAAGVDVLFDDRKARPGVKFKDGDLVGIPLRVVIGGRGLKEGNVEIKWRTAEGPDKIPVEEGVATLLRMLEERRAADAENVPN
ncbi:MAG: proline--tRNA ligase, partial [Planctomycetaceae bacterium]|nr:proline--tRNA ligase [Planctomycetaceae bacterium]